MKTSLLCLISAGVLSWPLAAGAQPDSTAMVAMRDSVELATDIYLPTGAEPWPVVLIRTPYRKSGVQDTGNALSDNGIAVVVQDLRGRFASQGTDCIFRCDGNDGFDTIAWVDAQSWSDGHIVSYGGSAVGIVQYMAAAKAPPALTAMYTIVATPSLYDELFFHGGVLRQNMVESWLEAQGSSFFLTDIVAHPLADSFWAPVQTAPDFGDVTVPAVHLGGWYDIFGQGTIDAFVGYQHSGGVGAAGKQKLIMGPWGHGIPAQTVGELTYPASAADIPGGLDALLLLWLQHYLGVAVNQSAIDAIPAVQYYVMGDVDDSAAPGNEWRTATAWPLPAAPIRLHLQPDGTLAEACPAGPPATSGYSYDPADPSPTIGGANLFLAAGPHDQRSIEARDDVVVFETPVLAAPLEITGRIMAHVWVEIDTVDADLMVRLSDVYPDGRSMLISDGAARLALRGTNDTLTPLSAGEIVEAVVDLWSTSIVIAAGHRLRVSITSSNSPRFFANPNDGTSYGGSATPRTVVVRLFHDIAHPSYLELPDPGRDSAEVTICAPAAADAGPGLADGGIGGDAGASFDDAGGCCRVGNDSGASSSVWLGLLLFLCWVRRRSRRA